MGWECLKVGVEVSCRISRHNSEQDERDDALADELGKRISEAVRPIVKDPRYADLILYTEGLE